MSNNRKIAKKQFVNTEMLCLHTEPQNHCAHCNACDCVMACAKTNLTMPYINENQLFSSFITSFSILQPMSFQSTDKLSIKQNDQ